ncbi:MAG: hypothetical protein P4L74_00165 [Candidatus Doudnabacteria bacterium]|nr:hypothetical protein [Candidatus Doudnabacteria bacterium]
MERLGFNPEEIQDISGGKKKFVIADISDAVTAKSKDVALDKSTESSEKPKGFWNRVKNFGKTVWKRSEINQTRERYKAEKEIIESGNLYAHDEGKDKKEAHNKEAGAITARYMVSPELEDQFIHKGAGETIDRLGNSHQEQVIKARIQTLIREYARGNLDEGGFHAYKNRIFAELHGLKPDALGKGKMYADNLFDIAKEVKHQVEQAVDHEAALRETDLDFDVVVGKAKAGVRTEAQFNAIDNIVDKIQRWTGGIFNEKTVAVAVASVNTIFTKVVQGSVKRAASVFGLGMAASGAVAAGRESRKLEVERMQHAREKAQGKEVKNPALAERRNELETSRIQTKSATELEKGVKTSLFDKLAGREAKDLTETEYNEALSAVGDIKARIQISDDGIVENPKTHMWQFWRSNKAKKVDLISFSDVTKVEQERARLNMVVYKARTELNKWAVANGRDFETEIRTKKDESFQELWHGEKGIKNQVKTFKKLKTRKVWIAAGKGALIGGAIGMVMQEAHALVSHDLHGFVGQSSAHSPGEHVTLVEGLRRRIVDMQSGHNTRFINLHEQTVAGHGFKLPEGYEMRPDGHGGFKIFDQSRAITDSFKLKPDGSLTPEAHKYLADHHFGPHEDLGHGGAPDQHHALSGSDMVEHGHHLTLAELKEKFPGLAKHHRVDSHDNPGKHFSTIHNKEIEYEGKQQELFLEQAKDGTVSMDANMVMANLFKNLHEHVHVDGNGDYHFDPEFGMNPDGTYDQMLVHMGPKLVEWAQNKTLQDHIQVAIIPTDAANHAGLSMLYEVAHNGKLSFPSEISSTFTDKSMLHDGHLPFRFMEFRVDGHVFATAQGHDFGATADHIIHTPGSDHFIPGHHEVPVTVLGRPENPTDYITEPPLIIPAYTRPGLEEMERTIEPPPPYGGYGRESEELRHEYRERMSPILRDNPQAQLDFEREMDWYMRNGIESNAYYKKDFESILKQPGMKEGMVAECRAVACIPVFDLGEGKVIENTLEQYRKQIANGSVKPEEFELILFLNHPKDRREALSMLPGADERVRNGNPEAYDTEEVIRQYQEKHPEMKIRVMKKEFEKRPMWGWIIKYLYDAACVRARNRKSPVNKDFLILTNDADLRDMSDKYLRYLMDDFDRNESEAAAGNGVRYDGMVGRIDHDNETYSKWPNFFLTTRFDQFLDAQNRYGYKGTETPYVDPETGYVVVNRKTGEKQVITQGRNTALRASAYCAVGGARVEKDAGADTQLGDMIRTGRRGVDNVLPKDRNPFAYENKAWLETDPRRELGMYQKGKPVAKAWDEWGEMNVYGKSFAEQIQGDQETINTDRLQQEFYWMMNKWRVTEDSPQVQRALAWLGLAGIETNDDGDPIDDHGNVITNVNSNKFVKYKDYEIGEIKIKDKDRKIITVRGIKILKTDHLKKKFESWKPKRERLNDAEQKRENDKAELEHKIKVEAKQKFEQNPLEFIYRNAGLQFQESSGIKPKTLVPGLFEAEGAYGEIEKAKEQAKYMQGSSNTRRTLAQLARLMAEKNPGLLAIWKGASPDLFERWALEINDKELRDKVGANNLRDADINALAAKYQIEPLKVLERVFDLKPSLKPEPRKNFDKQVSASGSREEYLRATLRKAQGITEIRRGPAPIGGPRVPGRPGGELRPTGTPVRGLEATRPRVSSAESAEDLKPTSARDLLAAIRARRVDAAKKPSRKVKKAATRKRSK